jgi:hypothetical protein
MDDVIGPDPLLATGRTLATFPNDHAICEAVWVPTLDDGFIPQGIALLGDGTALISGHVFGNGSVPFQLRIAHVDLADGSLLHLNIFPWAGRGHSILLDDTGRVWVATGQKLLTWANVDELFSGTAPKAVARAKPHDLALSYLAEGGGESMWIGSGFLLYEFPLDLLLAKANARKGSLKKLSRTEATTVLPTGKHLKGAVLTDPNSWTSASLRARGRCATLNVGLLGETRFGFVAGIGDVTLDESGALWMVSEAGSAQYPDQRFPFFPVIAKVDTTTLVEPPLGGCGVGTAWAQA